MSSLYLPWWRSERSDEKERVRKMMGAVKLMGAQAVSVMLCLCRLSADYS